MRKLPILVACACGAAVAAPAAGASSWEEFASHFDLRGTIGFSAGVDSNPEEESDGEGSAFGRTDGEIEIQLGESGEPNVTLTIDGAAVRFTDGRAEDDYRYAVDLEIEHPISEGVEISAGASRDRDATSEPTTTDDEVWAELAADAGIVHFEIRGTVSEYRESIAMAEIEAEDLEVFDYRSYQVGLRAEFDISGRVTPILEQEASAIDYLDRRPGKPERDAFEHSVLVGARAELTENTAVQIGVRGITRSFEADGVETEFTLAPDVEIEWQPNDRTSIELSAGRSFDEPTREEGSVRDEAKVELDWSYRATDRLRFNGGASISRTVELQTPYRKIEFEGFAAARYALRENLDALVEAYLDNESRRDDPGSDFTRAIVRAGLEGSF